MTRTALSLRLGTAVLAIVAGMGAVFGIVGNARADAANQGYQISPPVTTLALDPGTSTRQTIKITNLTDQQLTLQVGKRNFVAKGEEGEVELTDDANPLYSLAPYFTISQPTVVIPPRGTSQVQYVLSVPAGAEPGGRYGSVTFNTIAAKLPSGQSGASVQQEIAALIFLRINGATNEKVSVESFTTDKTFYEYGPVKFTTRVKNEGSVHEKPTGTITVKNMLGFTTAKIKLDEHNVIPGAIRRLNNTDISKSGDPTVGKALQHKYLFGRYTATLTMQNGTIQTLTAKTSFTVIPYKLLIILFIILVVLIAFLRRGRRRFGRAFRILVGRE